MHILMLSETYPPEVSACALRTYAHAKEWVALGNEVTILTCFPNFPKGKLFPGFKQSLMKRELVDGINIVRVPTLIFPNAGTSTRIIDYLSFMFAATIGGLFIKRPDIVVATSPQFFTAVAGLCVSKLRRRPHVMEIRDLWPDSIVAVEAMNEGKLIGFIRKIETLLYHQSEAIVTVTDATKKVLIEREIPADKISTVLNGADLTLLSPGDSPKLRKKLGLLDRFVVSYIGTIGMAHGLELLVETAVLMSKDMPYATLLIVGDGAERDKLRQKIVELGLQNVVFEDIVPFDEVVDFWRISDVSLIILKDTPLFRTVIPSKTFDALATGTPIVTNVAGELQRILNPLNCSIQVAVDDATAVTLAIKSMYENPKVRQKMSLAAVKASKNFGRKKQAEYMLSIFKGLI